MFSGSVFAPGLIAAPVGTTSDFGQSHAFPLYFAAYAGNSPSGSWRGNHASPSHFPWQLGSPGRSACRQGKRTRGICIQLAAPDTQSNAAKEENLYDEVQFEAAVASVRSQA